MGTTESERPLTREDGEALFAQVESVDRSGQAHAIVKFADAELQLERTPSGGWRLRAPTQPTWMNVYLAAPARPAEYSTELPFIPDESVTASEAQGTETLVWWAPKDPEGVFHVLIEATIEAGWALREAAPDAENSLSRRVYEHGGLERYIMLSNGIVTLVQRAAGRRPR